MSNNFVSQGLNLIGILFRETTITKLDDSVTIIGTAGIKLAPKSSFIKAIHLTNEQGEPLQPDQEA